MSRRGGGPREGTETSGGSGGDAQKDGGPGLGTETPHSTFGCRVGGAQRPLEAVGGMLRRVGDYTAAPHPGCRAGAPALRLSEPYLAVPSALLQMLP